MHPGATVAVQEARLIVETAARRGVPPQALLTRAGVAGAGLADAAARIPRAAFDRARRTATSSRRSARTWRAST